MPKTVGLLANKRDLAHLREVSTKQGKALARKHGSNFWEVSAADDYYSTHGPLNSMVVEAFLNTLTLKAVSGNSSSKSSSLIVSPPTNLRSLAAVDETTSMNDNGTLMINPNLENDDEALFKITSPSTPSFRYTANPFDFKNTNTNNSSDKPKSSKDRKKLELKLSNNSNGNDQKSKPVKKVSVGKLSLDSYLLDTNNNSPDSLNVSTDEDPVRSSSWSKKDKKRYSIRRSENKKDKAKAKDREAANNKETKELPPTTTTTTKTTTEIGVDENNTHSHANVTLRCHSCSDIKKWEKEGTPEREGDEDNISSNNNSVISGEKQPETSSYNGSLAPNTEKQYTNSFTRLSTYSSQEGGTGGDQLGPLRSPRTRKERRKTTGLTLKTAVEADEMAVSSPTKSPDIVGQELPSRFKRSEKKSVRRKISSIFRGPKLTIETPNG